MHVVSPREKTRGKLDAPALRSYSFPPVFSAAATAPFVFALFDVGGGEMMLIFLIALLLFGGQRMPDLARGIGKSLRELKKATGGVEQQIRQAMDEVVEKPRAAVRQTLTEVLDETDEKPASKPPVPPTPPEATP